MAAPIPAENGDIRTRPSAGSRSVRRRRSWSGFTLAEVMIATTLFTMGTLGVYQLLVYAYELSALCRYRDEARGIIMSFADQFSRLQTTYTPPGSPVSYQRYLFQTTNGFTGTGLVWGSSSNGGVSSQDTYSFTPTQVSQPYLSVSLGGTTNAIAGQVTRSVVALNPSNGASASSTTFTAAGYMLLGTFSINYTAYGKNYTQSVSVIRCVP
jgi:Tfp pilus assembly protein PilV